MTRSDCWQIGKRWCQARWLFFVGYASFFFGMGGYFLLFDLGGVAFYALFLSSLVMAMVFLLDFYMEYRRFQQARVGQPARLATASRALLQERVETLEEQLKEREWLERKWRDDLQDYYSLWAHQIKVPLAASQLLVADMEASPVKQDLEQELFKIEQYSRQVLNYLRLQSFHEDLVMQRLHLEEVVKAVVKKYSIFFIQKKIGLELGDLNRCLSTDERWLSLLLEQIVSNAIKYTEAGKVTISLEGEDLVIRDTGIGIAASDLHRVFDRGFSGYNGRMTQQSSGLGLYLSQKIAAELGYGLSLHSRVHQGTEVRITLHEANLLFK